MSTMNNERENHRLALEEIRKQMTGFGNQLLEYFDHIQAQVENYKFTVEKHGEGVEVEVQFKAHIHPKTSSDASKIVPK